MAHKVIQLGQIVPGISRIVICVSGCGLSATPLPAALPSFASALAGLAAMGWIRRKKAGEGFPLHPVHQ
jgi:hypothetical protein